MSKNLKIGKIIYLDPVKWLVALAIKNQEELNKKGISNEDIYKYMKGKTSLDFKLK